MTSRQSVFPHSYRDGQLHPGVIGGNLARVTCNALSSQTGLFLFHCGAFSWASRGVQLSRDARSVPACGLIHRRRKTRSPRDSFPELFKQLKAQFTNAGQVSSVSLTSAGAASRQAGSPAKSRPLPFVHVDHLTHSTVSNVSPARNSETKGRLFACLKKEFARS
jgi:hypothetical protein